MTSTRWQTLLLVAVVVAVPAYVLLRLLETNAVMLPVPGYMWAGFAVLAVVLLLLGRGVRRLTRGKRTTMDSLGAARVAALAKASALGGAGLVGYFAAQLLTAFRNLDAPALRSHALSSGAASLACLVLVGVALLVEWWCRIPPDDEGDNPA